MRRVRTDSVLRVLLALSITCMVVLGTQAGITTVVASPRVVSQSSSDRESLDREVGINTQRLNEQRERLAQIEHQLTEQSRQLDARILRVEELAAAQKARIDSFTSAVKQLVGSVLAGLVVMVLKSYYAKRQMEAHRKSIRHDIRTEFATALNKMELQLKQMNPEAKPEAESES